MAAVLAIDIGGTKLAAGRVRHDGTLLERQWLPTPTGSDPEAIWTAVVELVDSVTRGDEDRCGVGCGGPMSAGGEAVSPLNIGAWRDFPLKQRLHDLTGLPVCIDNDAKALARGEGWVGSAAGAADFLAMVVSTGIGGGIVLDGRLLDGAAGNAGHIGHLIVEPAGRTCGCGARGCLEAEASGTAIAAMTGAAPAEAGPELRQRVGRLVGRAVASVANLLDLRLAVIAGSVALGYGSDFFGPAQAEVERCARLDFSRGTRIVPAKLGDAAPLIGAAAVALHAAS